MIVSQEIVKSISDGRDYRYLKLPNELQTLLIHDPEAEMSAASMFVGVGSLSDPVNPNKKDTKFNGMAHFCEHMLFQGTKKYPEENYYLKYMGDHGGETNANTGDDETNFHFDVTSANFPEAIDIFSQFFKEPIFNKAAIDREMHAVDSEYNNGKSNEAFATDYLEKSVVAEPGSVIDVFSVGNLESLSQEGVYDNLKKFYNDHYSSNRMNLVLVGK